MSREIKFKRAHFENSKFTEYTKWGIGVGGASFANPVNLSEEYIDYQFVNITIKGDNDIYEGHFLQHNENIYLVRMDEKLRFILLENINEKGNWRGLDWLDNVKKYVKIVGDVNTTPEFLN